MIHVVLILLALVLVVILLLRQDSENFVDNKKITIVYFAYLTPRWKNIVLPQMKDLKSTGLLEVANLHVVMTGDPERTQEAKTEISDILRDYIISFRIERENRHEYPGIHELYRLALQNPTNIMLYFHAKGIWRDRYEGEDDGRVQEELVLFDRVIKPWKTYITILQTRPDINKVCLGASEGGWCWYNFYWVRASHVIQCGEPIVTDNRYYYEEYIGTASKHFADVYNIVDAQPFYHSYEMGGWMVQQERPK